MIFSIQKLIHLNWSWPLVRKSVSPSKSPRDCFSSYKNRSIVLAENSLTTFPSPLASVLVGNPFHLFRHGPGAPGIGVPDGPPSGQPPLFLGTGPHLVQLPDSLIHKGTGRFQSQATPSRAIGAQTAFLLFPGVWHRYRPDPGGGWTESWIEFQGSYVEHLRQAGVIDPRHPVYRIHSSAEIELASETAAGVGPPQTTRFYRPARLLAVEILALLRWSSLPRQTTLRRMDQVISESQALLAGDSRGNFRSNKSPANWASATPISGGNSKAKRGCRPSNIGSRCVTTA